MSGIHQKTHFTALQSIFNADITCLKVGENEFYDKFKTVSKCVNRHQSIEADQTLATNFSTKKSAREEHAEKADVEKGPKPVFKGLSALS